MNVIDDKQLQSALTGVTDAATQSLLTQVLPVVSALVDSAVTKLCTEVETTISEALADLTAERQEFILDVNTLLGRLDGMTITLNLSKKEL